MAPPQPRKGPVRIPQNPLMGGYSPYGPPNSGNPLDFTKGQGLPGQPTGARPGGYSPYGPPNSGNPLSVVDGLMPRFNIPMQRGGAAAAMPGPTSPLSGEASTYGMSSSPSRGALLSRQTVSPPLSPDAALAGRIDALTARSKVQSPLTAPQRAPVDQMLDTIQSINSQLPNFRYGDMTQPAGQAYSNGLSLRPEDIRSRLANREGALQPGGVQMQRRFAPESPLGQQAAEYQRGLTGVERGEGVFIQPGGRGSDQTYLQFNNTPEGAAAVAAEKARARREDPLAPGYRSPEKRVEQLKQGLERQRAAIEAGKPKQRAEARKQDLQDRTLKRAVTRGLNPLSPQAQALYPEAVGRLRAARAGGQGAPASPLIQSRPFASGPGGEVTAQDKNNALTTVRGIAYGVPGPPDKDGNPTPGTAPNPFMVAMGADPDKEPNIDTIHAGMIANMNSNTGVVPTAEDLRQLRTYVDGLATLNGDQGAITRLPKLWKDLVSLPADASDEDVNDWYRRFKQEAPVAPNESVGRWELPLGM